MAGTPGNNDGVDIFSILDPKTGDRYAQAYLTPKSDTREKNVYLKVPAVIPIVFLPGIMGTNLRVKGKSNEAWRPPNLEFKSAWELITAAWTWSRRNAKERQKILAPDATEVDDSGSIDTGRSGLSPALAQQRGWGTVMRSCYHPLMAVLQERLNNIARSGGVMTNFKPQIAPWWGGQDMTPRPGVGPGILAGWNHGIAPPADYGAESELPALTETELMQAARYSFDVWCCGYNWLQSNRDSALVNVKKFLEQRVFPHYAAKGIPAEKAILVTHSMGGLVARALTQLHGYDKVLGVVHGVQPATGAPTIYHHMRCGYEDGAQYILGRDAAQVTAVVANAPGALELAPTFDHQDGGPWLFVMDKHNQPCMKPLPAKGDPYTEIYLNPDWYGLVPESNTKYLDLSGDQKSDPKYKPRGNFEDLIEDVEQFHRDFARKYHPETYAHYGADTSEDRHGWEKVHWKGDPDLLKNSHDFFDDGNGAYRFAWGAGTMGVALQLEPGRGSAGDGTVAAPSGAAPGRAGVKASFRHGSQGKGAKNQDKGYEHQDSYLDPRAQWAALYSIVKIAQLADWYD